MSAEKTVVYQFMGRLAQELTRAKAAPDIDVLTPGQVFDVIVECIARAAGWQ